LELVITRFNEPEITVDNLEVAQFIYRLLHNEKIREVIDTITANGVSANRLHGFGRLMLQNLFSLHGTSRVEYPYMFVHLGGSYDAPNRRIFRHPHPPGGAAYG
jgi:hypothetical protein